MNTNHHDAVGVQLSKRVKYDLVSELRKRQNAHVEMAFVECSPSGMAIGFEVSAIFTSNSKLGVFDLLVAQV